METKFDIIVDAIGNALNLPSGWSVGTGDKQYRLNLVEGVVVGNNSATLKVAVDFYLDAGVEQLISVAARAIKNIAVEQLTFVSHTLELRETSPASIRVVFSVEVEVFV